MFPNYSVKNNTDGSSHVVVLPDLQNYSGKNGKFLSVLDETMNWIIEQRSLNIEAVFQLGDLTDKNLSSEWERVRSSFRKLDGEMPYFLTVGNHDLGFHSVGSTRETLLNDYFSLTDNFFNQKCIIEEYEVGRMENTVSKLRLGNREWLIIAMEFGTREGVLNWVNLIIKEHSDMPTIIVTHEYMDELSYHQNGIFKPSSRRTFNSPYQYGIADLSGGVNAGEDILNKVLEGNLNVELILNGHYRPFAKGEFSEIQEVPGLAEARLETVRGDGSIIHQMMFNAQWEKRGGNGWLLLLQFDKEGNYKGVSKYSPLAAGVNSMGERVVESS